MPVGTPCDWWNLWLELIRIRLRTKLGIATLVGFVGLIAWIFASGRYIWGFVSIAIAVLAWTSAPAFVIGATLSHFQGRKRGAAK
jgi:hypothetical protein